MLDLPYVPSCIATQNEPRQKSDCNDEHARRKCYTNSHKTALNCHSPSPLIRRPMYLAYNSSSSLSRRDTIRSMFCCSSSLGVGYRVPATASRPGVNHHLHRRPDLKPTQGLRQEHQRALWQSSFQSLPHKPVVNRLRTYTTNSRYIRFGYALHLNYFIEPLDLWVVGLVRIFSHISRF